MFLELPKMSALPSVAYGSDAIVRQLHTLNIPYIALVPGSSFRGLHNSIVNFAGNRRPKIVLCLHEEHSVAIAHGYAKVEETPMAVAVHDAHGRVQRHCDRAPVLILGGNGPLNASLHRPWIDWIHTTGDESALIRPWVKYDDTPASVPVAVQSILTAATAAAQLPRGPTYVCLDVSLQEIKLPNPATFPFPSTERYLNAARNPPGPSAQSVQAIHEAMVSAKQQLLFLYGHVNRTQAGWDNRVTLAEAYNARVITDLKLAAAFPTDRCLQEASPEETLRAPAIHAIRASDVIVSFDWVDLAGTLATCFPDHPLGEPPASIRVIHITLDPPAIGNGQSKTHFAQPPVDLTIISADPDLTITALLNAYPPPTQPSVPPPSTPFHPVQLDPSTPLTLTTLAQTLYHLIPPATISLVRVPLRFPGSQLHTPHPLSHLGHDGGEGVGSGPGMVVGAALALMTLHSSLFPVAILGDGDFLMGCSAIWTAARYGVPLLALVANNGGFYNDERHQAEVARQRGRDVGRAGVGTRIEGPRPDVMSIARGFGAMTVGEGPVSTVGGLVDALVDAMKVVTTGKVVVVDVWIENEER
ncbi:Benzoylformate decarboxylase [Staphylotrichum tortipilum]|uniref:Benzoylformate decarboxylase n=1 Tax=Staphylotrichum tortipilum TaxID=2831512 RepID=A0AAN6MPP9_9PEZI|nr:Benzoylformate decarboxylase [Staphylotrichum longicolle]